MKFFSGRGFSRTAAIAAAMTCVSTTLAQECNIAVQAVDATIGKDGKLEVRLVVDSVSAVGAQFVIRYDTTKLSLDVNDGNAYTLPQGSPLNLELYESVSADIGMYKLALGTTEGNVDADIHGTIATLTFTPLVKVCNVRRLVSFGNDGRFAAKFAKADGTYANLVGQSDLDYVTYMPDMPVMSAAPAARWFWADANGTNGAAVSLQDPTATDACNNVAPVTSNEKEVYPAGVDTTVTYTATDICGNQSTNSTHVDVKNKSLVLAKVAMGGAFDNSASFGRGIKLHSQGFDSDTGSLMQLEAAGSGNSSHAEGEANAQVPASSDWFGTCTEVSDPKHTLRATVNIGAEDGYGIHSDGSRNREYNSRYNADAKSASQDWLVVGNLNGDDAIDIMDFAAFVPNRGTSAVRNTTTTTQGVHADMNASGVVNNADLSYLAVNFFKLDETCSSGFTTRRPLERIKVSQLRAMGLGDQAMADINGDGWVDTTDMSLMMQGAQPRNTTSAKKPVVDGGVMAP